MLHIDDVSHLEPFFKEHNIYEKIFARFDNVFYCNRTTNNVVPNSIYIYNNININYRSPVQQQIVDIPLSFPAPLQSHDGNRMGDVMFTGMPGGNILGEYYAYENILVLANYLYDMNNHTAEIIKKILDWLSAAYVIDKSILADIKPRDDAYLTIGDHTFMLRSFGAVQNNRQLFIDSVTKKSRDTIIKMRRAWTEQLEIEKARYERLRKASRLMPDVPYLTAIQNRLSLSKENMYIVYSFNVDIVAEEAMNENTRKQIKIEPINYKGILSLYLDEKDILKIVKFTDVSGTGTVHHLHVDRSNHILCVGSTELIGKVLRNVDEVIAAKERLVRAMSIINLGSCMSSSDPVLYDKLITQLTVVDKPNIDDVWRTE